VSNLPPEKPRRDWRLFALIARTIVGGLFAISAFGKIEEPGQFAEEIRAYAMVPVATTNAIAYVLPWIELLAGLLLISCLWRREARFIMAVLLAVFIIAKGYTFAQGKTIDCGCGGSVAVLKYIYNSPQGILTNLVLLALLGVDRRAERLARAAQRASREACEAETSDTPESA
jgi:uncharacterized membrane protein YphA (DoxX/SURF4 family)